MCIYQMKNKPNFFLLHFRNFVFYLQWLTMIMLTTFAIFFLTLIDESTAIIAEPQAPNFQYFER